MLTTEEIQELTDRDELNRIIFDCQGRLENMKEEARAAAEEQIQAIADEAGLTVEEITGLRARPVPKATTHGKKKAAGRTSKAPAKYKHPDHVKGWSGVGRMPDWMKNHVEAGGSKEDYAIPAEVDQSASERRTTRGKGDM